MSLKDKLQIMVVDDMSTSRGILTQSLDRLGLQNYAVEADGAAAFERLKQRPVHLVLSDYNMPGVNGLQLLQALRSTQATAKIGFILVTGRPTPDVIDAGKRLAMNNYIKKPFAFDDMKACIEAVVGRL